MEIKFRRAKLSLFSAVRIGSHGMLQKPVRLLVVIFLTTVALIMFGLSVTVAMYDEERAIAESMVLYDEATLVAKTEGGSVTAEDLSALRGAAGKAFAAFEGSGDRLPAWQLFTAGEEREQENAPADIRRELTGFIVLSEEAIEESGFSLLGRLPEAKDEIVVPCCLAESFVRFGYYDHIKSPQGYDETGNWVWDEDCVIPVRSHEEAIGKKLYLSAPLGDGQTEAVIVGVLEYECPFRERHGIGAPPETALEDRVAVSKQYAEEAMGDGIGSYALAGPPRNAAEALRLLRALGGEGEFALMSDCIDMVEEYRAEIEGITSGFVGVGVAFAVFAGALIYQFINLSIEAKRGQVGILRALGARSSDVCRIFFSESFLLALAGVVLAVPATVGLSYAVNQIIRDLSGIRVPILNFTVWMPVCIFVLGFVIAFAATVFPVLKEAKKAPIDAIRDAA